MGRGKLRAVEQRKPLFGGERNRREFRAIESFVRRQRFAGEARFADANHRRGHMRERARGRPRRRPSPCEGTTGVTPRLSISCNNASVSGRTPEAPWARLASFSAIINRVVASLRCFADARRVRKHDVALQARKVGVVDANVSEFAEPGVDAIDRLAARENALNRGGAGGDARP